MSELIYETENNLARSKNDNKRSTQTVNQTTKRIPVWVKWTMLGLFWLLLVLGSYGLANAYIGGIHDQLEHIQQTNEAHVQALNKKLDSLQMGMKEHQEQAAELNKQFGVVQQELGVVKEEMSLAGDTLNSSAETKQALSERITALDNELGELRKLIKKLEEAARVY